MENKNLSAFIIGKLEVMQMEKKLYKVFYKTLNGTGGHTFIEADEEETIKAVLRCVQGMQTELISYELAE